MSYGDKTKIVKKKELRIMNVVFYRNGYHMIKRNQQTYNWVEC